MSERRPQRPEVRRRVRRGLDDLAADAARSPLDGLRRRLRRAQASWLPILQLVLAAGAAWLVATELVGHVQPFFAPVAAVVTVIAGLGQRRRVVLDLVLGVSIGVLAGELLIGLIGRGTWQLVLVVALAAVLTLLLDVGRLAVVQACTSAILLVAVVPVTGTTTTAAVDRFVDTLIGGTFGLLAAALIPANPVRRLDREVGGVVTELAALLDGAARALRWGDAGVAWTALQQGRALQAPLESLTEAASTAHELSRIAPLRWRQRDQVGSYERSLRYVDHAVRDARVLARRVHTMLRRRDRSGEALAPVLEQLASAVRSFGGELAGRDDPAEVRDALLSVARSATDVLDRTHSLGVVVVVAQTRSIAADLLYAHGVTAVELDDALGLGSDSP